MRSQTQTEGGAGAANVTVGLLFGFGSAICYGTAQVLARQGVSSLAPPLIGSFISLFWGTLGLSLLSVRSLGRHSLRSRRGILFCAGGGVFSSTAVTLSFLALTHGPVVIVSPITATNPLFTLIFAAIFLRGIERITPRIFLGAMGVVAGVIVMTIW